jgi:uncharacterized membrane protein YhhN
MLAYSLTGCIGLSALATLGAAYSAPRTWFYLFKPLTTLLILLLALLAPAVSRLYQSGLAAGLALSLAGDIFLMLSAKRFIWGLASFLLAHASYMAAFTAVAGFREPPWLALPFLIAGVGFTWQIAPRARSLRWPVTVYGLVLVAMAWRACALWAVTGSAPAWLACLGAGLFVLSDVTLAINRFIRRFRFSQILVLSTYYAAQCLLAWSVWP